MKKVYIVILTYKGSKETLELLDSLLKLKTGGLLLLKTLVVDNYPKEPFKVDKANYQRIGLDVVYNSENLGFSGGNNVGIKHALKKGADYILVLNNDTLVDENFLIELVKLYESKKDAGLIAPKIYFEKGYEFHKKRYKESEQGKVIWYAGGEIDWQNVIARHRGVDEVDEGQYSQVTETEFASGCCFIVSSEILKKFGMLDDRYFLYYEDSDLSMRIKRGGHRIYFNPKSVIWHKNASSSGGSGSDLQDYYMTRNRIIFALSYASMRAKAAVIKEGLRLLLTGRKWQKKGVLDFFLRNFGRGSYSVS